MRFAAEIRGHAGATSHVERLSRPTQPADGGKEFLERGVVYFPTANGLTLQWGPGDLRFTTMMPPAI